VDFGSELGLGSCFTPHYGTHMGLVDAHNPILYLMGTLLKHCQMLEIDRLNDPVLPPKGGIQGKDLELVQLFFNRLEVPSQVLELEFDPVSDGLFGRIFILGYFQITFSGPFAGRL
jgi:hypothetical protein